VFFWGGERLESASNAASGRPLDEWERTSSLNSLLGALQLFADELASGVEELLANEKSQAGLMP
jgi:hypothetical protein